MALRTLLLRKQLGDLRKEEEQLRSQQAEFEKREGEIAQAIEEAQTDDDKAAVEAAVEELETNQKTVKERLQALTGEINDIVAQIEESEKAQQESLDNTGSEEPAADENTEETGERSRRRGEEKRSMNKMTERAAQEFQRSGKHAYKNVRSLIRAALTTTDTTKPVGVGGINDPLGGVSSLIDLVKLTDCTGMGAYRIALMTGDGNVAGERTEGQVPGEGNPTFDYVEILPKMYGTIDYVSKEIRKQTPLNYEEKVTAAARRSLRRCANAQVIDALKTTTHAVEKTGVTIGPNTLSDIILSYGGDETTEGEAYIILSKADLKAFNAVRGKNEYLPVYSIVPDQGTSSTGTIKDNNGLSCRYVLSSGLESIAAGGEMYYGSPACLEVGLWGDFEVEVNEGYKFGEGLLTVRGEVTMGAAVNTVDGFIRVKGGA